MTEKQENTILTAERAVKHNPTDPELQVTLGMAYFHAERLDAAMAAFQQALALNPDTPTAHNGIWACVLSHRTGAGGDRGL